MLARPALKYEVLSRSSDRPATPRAARAERRDKPRIITLYRIARLSTDLDEGLCRVQNISDFGMGLTTELELCCGGSVRVMLSDTVALSGTVLWAESGQVGIRFAERVDAAAILQRLVSERLTGKHRQPRVPVNAVGFATAETGIQAVRVLNVSQKGMRVAHDGSFVPGLHVKILLENGIERRGVVRWSENATAGLQLLEPIRYQDLQSASLFRG